MLTITEAEFQKLTDLIRKNYGIHLKEEKKSLIIGRLQQVLFQQRHKNFTEYLEYIVSDKTGKAIETLLNRITTNHTFFMREAEHFKFFKEQILPNLITTVRDRDLRIWSAGCSTGEEPYTLAMILADFLGKDKARWDSKILATDLSSEALSIATQGEYAQDKIASLPANWRQNYFKKCDCEKTALIDKIRNEVIFRRFNLLEAVFPFKQKFHVVFCRNVMIYFDQKTKNELVHKFYQLTEKGGYLFIGHSESLDRTTTKYKYIMPAVYRKE